MIDCVIVGCDKPSVDYDTEKLYSLLTTKLREREHKWLLLDSNRAMIYWSSIRQTLCVLEAPEGDSYFHHANILCTGEIVMAWYFAQGASVYSATGNLIEYIGDIDYDVDFGLFQTRPGAFIIRGIFEIREYDAITNKQRRLMDRNDFDVGSKMYVNSAGQVFDVSTRKQIASIQPINRMQSERYFPNDLGIGIICISKNGTKIIERWTICPTQRIYSIPCPPTAGTHETSIFFLSCGYVVVRTYTEHALVIIDLDGVCSRVKLRKRWQGHVRENLYVNLLYQDGSKVYEYDLKNLCVVSITKIPKDSEFIACAK